MQWLVKAKTSSSTPPLRRLMLFTFGFFLLKGMLWLSFAFTLWFSAR